MSARRLVVAAQASDADLMDRVLEDDAEAFALLYDRYAAKGYRIARSVCHRPGAAEDAMQEAFVSIWRSRLTYRPGGQGFAAWAMTIVRNRAIDMARREAVHDRRRSDDAAGHDRPASVDIAADATASDEAARLRELLADLPAEQREVIALAFYGQLSHSEIAAHLGLPTGTVKGRMRLGLQKLGHSLAA